MARRVLSKFRVDYSQTPANSEFEELIAELTKHCPIFRRLWETAEVMSRSEGVAHYPHLGGVSFEHSSYVPEGTPTLRASDLRSIRPAKRREGRGMARERRQVARALRPCVRSRTSSRAS